MPIVTEPVYIGSELNVIRLEIQQGGTAVGEAFFDLITRVVVRFGDAVVDSDTATAGTFDWTTEKASSILRLVLGQQVVAGDFATLPGTYWARMDIFQTDDNAVISHDDAQQLRFRVYADAP